MPLQRLDTAIQPRERQKRFLTAFATCGSILRASRWAGVHRQAHYWWMREDATYPLRFREAQHQAARMLEDEAVRRAHEGVSRPVLYKGKPVFVEGRPLHETEYSDSLLMFLLKAYAPDKFKDRAQIDHAWDGDLDKLTEEQLAKVKEGLLARYHAAVALEAAQGQLPASEQVVDVTPDVTPART